MRGRATAPSMSPSESARSARSPVSISYSVRPSAEMSVRGSARFAEVLNGGDVGGRGLRDERRLAGEHANEAFVVRVVGQNPLHDARPLEPAGARLAGEKDLGHAARGELPHEGVLAEPLAH